MARSMTARSSAGSGRLLGHTNDEAGFSLVEALVSFTLFTIIAVTATWGLVKTIQITTVSRDRTAASNLAAQEIEKMRSQNSTGHQVDSTAFTVTEHNITYTVSPSMYPDPHNITAPSCDSGNSTAANPTPPPTPATTVSSTATATPTPTSSPTATATPTGAVVMKRYVSVVVTWNGNPLRSTRYDTVLSC